MASARNPPGSHCVPRVQKEARRPSETELLPHVGEPLSNAAVLLDGEDYDFSPVRGGFDPHGRSCAPPLLAEYYLRPMVGTAPDATVEVIHGNRPLSMCVRRNGVKR